MSSDSDSQPLDPIVEAAIERALKPYVGVAPSKVLAAMRASLEELLTTHPDAVGIIQHLRARGAPLKSGDVPIGHADRGKSEGGTGA